jgi:hypothetical protein
MVEGFAAVEEIGLPENLEDSLTREWVGMRPDKL